jgi:hypothetical protein
LNWKAVVVGVVLVTIFARVIIITIIIIVIINTNLLTYCMEHSPS